MKILIVNSISVYPVKAMNQMRTHNMIRILSKSFFVSLATPVSSDEENLASEEYMKRFGCTFYSLKSNKPKGNLMKRRWSLLKEMAAYYFQGLDKEYTRYKYYNSDIIQLINNNNFNVVISNYWEGSSYFLNLGNNVYKVLDPHYAVADNWSVFKQKKKNVIQEFFEYRRLKMNTKLERQIIGVSDLCLPLSKRNYEEFTKVFPQKQAILIEDGNDLDYFLQFPKNPEPRTILFYGAMSSQQNIGAFWRFYNFIFPALKDEFPDLKLLIVGANPPEKIKALNDEKNIIVTGFVEDIRPYLAQSWFSIIPLELGSGFRGRVIELMAMGVPVLGTHNALDCIGFVNGEQGFISDSNGELVKMSLKILKSHQLRNEISMSALEFVKNHYSLESTFGKLRKYFTENNIIKN